MTTNYEQWHQASTTPPNSEDQVIVVYYSYPSGGFRVSSYEVGVFNGSWNFRHSLPNKAKIHSWQYLDTFLNSKIAKEYRKENQKDNVHLWFSPDAYQWRKSFKHCVFKTDKEDYS